MNFSGIVQFLTRLIRQLFLMLDDINFYDDFSAYDALIDSLIAFVVASVLFGYSSRKGD